MSASTPVASSRRRNLLLLVAAIVVIGGGGAAWLASLDASTARSDDSSKNAATSETSSRFASLRTYVDTHTADLVAATTSLDTAATDYAKLVAKHEGDYAALAASSDAGAAGDAIQAARTAYADANPAYEEMEGIVAGVPSLAKYDVSIDAGAPASEDPEGAVEFDVQVSEERVLEQPGNFFLLAEATLYGTEQDWTSGVAFDVDGDGGTTQFGDLLPDADVLSAVSRDFVAEAKRLERDASAWKPTESDAFTALVVMTPTMGEYFTSWKQSRFVAGDASKERAFVSSSRLTDVVGILSGLEVIRASLDDRMRSVDPAAAASVERDLAALTTFVDDIRAREAGGTRFTAAQADRFGTDAQEQAEQVTARVTDIARELGVDIDA